MSTKKNQEKVKIRKIYEFLKNYMRIGVKRNLNVQNLQQV